jgi:hypothetical protein
MMHSSFRSARLPAATLAFGLLLAAACSKNTEVNSTPAPGGTGGASDESPDPATVGDDVLAISGTVTDAESSAAIAGALVQTEPPIGQIRTNGQGQYVFSAGSYPGLAKNQMYRITATKDGYLTDFAYVTPQAGHSRNVDIILQKSSEAYFLEISSTKLELTDADFNGGNIGFKTITLRLDTQTDDRTQYATTVDAAARSWLSVIPAEGEVTGTEESVDIQIDKSGLPAGISTGKINFTVPGDSIEVTVRVTLSG